MIAVNWSSIVGALTTSVVAGASTGASAGAASTTGSGSGTGSGAGSATWTDFFGVDFLVLVFLALDLGVEVFLLAS